MPIMRVAFMQSTFKKKKKNCHMQIHANPITKKKKITNKTKRNPEKIKFKA
jgi:hypothetical protein